MPARVVSSLDDDENYSINRDILQKGLKDDIKFKGQVKSKDREFSFEHKRTYDFVRTAGAKIRDAMTNYLRSILLDLDEDAKQDLRSAFEKLFNYNSYKGKLNKEGQKVGKSMKLLIFNPEENGELAEDYVAKVNFSCNTIKGPKDEYTVYTSITCQEFTWFEFEEDLPNSLRKLSVRD